MRDAQTGQGDCEPNASPVKCRILKKGPYLEGQGDSVSRLIRGITGVTIWVIGVINLPTKSP